MRISDWSSDVCSSDLPSSPLQEAEGDEAGASAFSDVSGSPRSRCRFATTIFGTAAETPDQCDAGKSQARLTMPGSVRPSFSPRHCAGAMRRYRSAASGTHLRRSREERAPTAKWQHPDGARVKRPPPTQGEQPRNGLGK